MSRQITKRHSDIADIACNLGANVTAKDVAIIAEATRVEYEERTDRPAAGGKAKHDQFVWGGLRQ